MLPITVEAMLKNLCRRRRENFLQELCAVVQVIQQKTFYLCQLFAKKLYTKIRNDRLCLPVNARRIFVNEYYKCYTDTEKRNWQLQILPCSKINFQ